ncbi:MAG: hypothetical protein HDR25_04125 [Lachnospiraceae bacterium]|nr:hypothetical protein [Lachnospiraceae bacterium]
MLKIKNKFTKRILALVLSGAMIVTSLTTSGLTAYAAEDAQNTHSGYSEEISETDNEAAQMEEAEENEGNKDAENPVDAEDENDFEETTKAETVEAEPSKTELDKEEPVKTEATKENSDKEEPVEADSTEKEEAKNTDDEEQEKDEKAEDVKAYTYSAPSASAKGAWDNYEVFRGSVFGYSSKTVTDKNSYNLGTDNGKMRIKALDNGNKIALTDDGRAMYFYQVPIDSTFELRAKATINSIGNIGEEQERNDAQVGFGLMARDDMLIDVKYNKDEHTNGAGCSSNYVAAGTLMGSALGAEPELQTSINCFSRVDGTLKRGASLGKIITSGEYALSIKFDGTKYICQMGDNDPVEYTVSLNKIDSAYQYIGMFVARKADITFSDIYLTVDDERILDQVSPRYNVTVSKEGNGTVTVDGTTVIVGDTVTLTAKPSKGYYLDDWQIVEGTDLVTDIEIDENNQFTMPDGNVSIKAIFREIPTEWDFENDNTLSARFEETTGKVAGLKIDATNGTFDSTGGLAQISEGTTITVPLAGECTLTVVGENKNYTVDGKAATEAEDSFTCGGIFLKTAVITATADTAIKCITVTSSGKEEIVLPETPRKIDVWDFGAKEQSGSNYVNHIKVSDWTNFSNLASGRFTVASGDDPQHPIEDATASFGDLTFCYHVNDILYSTAYTGAFNHQSNQSMRAEATHAYGDYTAAGEWYCNGTGGSNRRNITIENVVAGDIIYAYVGISNGVETNFYFEYLGTDGEQKDSGTVEKGDSNGVNKKLTFTAKYSGTYKIWAEADTTGKPFYNRIVRYPAVGVQGSIDWAGISREGVSIQFVNDSTKEATNAVFDSAGYAVILVPGYSYTIKLVGKENYSFAESCRKITVSNTDGINGKTHNLVVQDLEALPKQAVSGKFIGSGEVPLTGVEATKLVFKNIDDDYIYEAQIENDAYSINLRKGTYLAEITADGYSTRTHVIVNNASVERDLFLASTDTSPLPLVKDLYVGYPDEEENNFPTINAALRVAKRMNPQKEEDRITVHIYPGTYREQVFVNANYITLINDTPSQDVLITWYYGIGYAYYSADDSGGKGTGYYNEESAYDKFEKHNAARWGCAVRVKATDFKAKNIIFENSFNRYITEEEIADGVALSTEGAGTEISFKRTASVTPTQAASISATERAAAIALDTGSDRSEFYNCKFYSSQDTLYTGDGNSRAYYKNCFISGNTDYIFGDGNQVFENCELNWIGYTNNSKGEKGGHITAAKDTSTLGYLFYNCTITKPKESGFTAGAGTLGRTWGAKARVTYVNTVQEASNLISDSGWGNMNGDPKSANYKEYNTTLKNGTEINHNTSPRKDKYTTTNPIDTPEKLEAYFGEDWKPTFYERSTEGGDTGESGSTPETGNTNESGSTPESSNTGESESTPESSGTNESGGDDKVEDIYIRGLEPSYPYTGAKIIPDIEVLDGTTILSPDVDYKVSYKNNVKPGTDTAEVIVTGKGNYAGKAFSKKFSIVETEDVKENLADLKGAKMDKIAPVEYKGEAWYPDFTLTFKDGSKATYIQNTNPTDDSKGLYKIKDSDQPMNVNVAVSNNINKGTATILITGAKDGNKTTSIKKTFKITAVDISTAEVKAEDATYAVSGAIPKVTVEYKKVPLKLGKDYTLKYAKNKTAASKGTVTVVGKGNYAKKHAPVEYTINKLDMSTLTVNAVTASVGGKPGKIKATINDGNGTALKAAQYTLSVYQEDGQTPYSADTFGTEGETIYVVATAKEGSKDLTGSTPAAEFKVGVDISKAKIVSAVDGKAVTKSYRGRAITLEATDLKVTLKVNGKEETLEPNKDYKIATHFNNINKGNATVVIQGIGKYGGTKAVKFKITQRSIQDTDLRPWKEMSKAISNRISSLSSK